MTFDELRARLVQHGLDPLSVIDRDHDGPDAAAAAPADAWVIYHGDTGFEVGGRERGRFVVTAVFDTEQQACDYLADELLRTHVVPETTEQRAASEAVSDDFYATMQRRLGDAPGTAT